MRLCIWTLLVPAAIVFAPVQIAAGEPPRACLDWQSDPKGPLPRNDVDNVIYRPLLFKRAGKNYDVETYSDMSPIASENCFRWEVVNSSKSPDLYVDELSWPAAGIRVRHMRPGDENRDYNNRREAVQPDKKTNPVYAFENEVTPTQSWVSSAQTASDKPSSGSTLSLAHMTTSQVLPGLNAEPSILSAVVDELSLKYDQRAPEISHVVGYGKLAVRIRSSANSDGKMVRIATTALVANVPSAQVRVNLPALEALRKTAPTNIGDVGEAKRFLDNFYAAIKEPGSNRAEWTVPVAVNTKGEYTVFRVRQPVVVTAGEERHCYLVSTYTPIPIGMTLRQCW